MKRRPYRWDDLRVLLAVVRRGSLAGAAAELEVDATTVGRRLEALEAALGVQLVERTPEGIVATAAADVLRTAAEGVERSANEVDRALAGLESAPEGVVRIAAPPAICTHFVAPTLVRLRRRHPGLQVHVNASNEIADLTLREADLALRTVRPASGDLVSQKVASSESVVLVSTASRSLDVIEDANAVDWVTWTAEWARLPDAAWVTANVRDERIALRASTLEAQIAAARAGMGAVLLSRAFRGVPGLREPKLGRGLADSLRSRGAQSLWLVTHRALRHVPRVDAAWTFVVEEAARLGA